MSDRKPPDPFSVVLVEDAAQIAAAHDSAETARLFQQDYAKHSRPHPLNLAHAQGRMRDLLAGLPEAQRDHAVAFLGACVLRASRDGVGIPFAEESTDRVRVDIPFVEESNDRVPAGGDERVREAMSRIAAMRKSLEYVPSMDSAVHELRAIEALLDGRTR